VTQSSPGTDTAMVQFPGNKPFPDKIAAAAHALWLVYLATAADEPTLEPNDPLRLMLRYYAARYGPHRMRRGRAVAALELFYSIYFGREGKNALRNYIAPRHFSGSPDKLHHEAAAKLDSFFAGINVRGTHIMVPRAHELLN
jgi:hypothetical protein